MSATVAEQKFVVEFVGELPNELEKSIRDGASYLESVANQTVDSLDGKMKLTAEFQPADALEGKGTPGRKGVRLQLELIQSIQNVSISAWLSEQHVADPTRRDIELLRLFRAVVRHWSDVHMRRFDRAMDELMANELEVIPNA